MFFSTSTVTILRAGEYDELRPLLTNYKRGRGEGAMPLCIAVDCDVTGMEGEGVHTCM